MSYTASNGWKYYDTDYFEMYAKSTYELSNLASSLTIKGLTERASSISQMEIQNQLAAIEAVSKAKKEHPKTARERNEKRKETRDAILSGLRAAQTPNGQLVAAVLEEEDGKTAEEIAGWCDELAFLSQEEMDSLLNDLLADGVIRKTGDKYYLKRLCTADLVFHELNHFKRWASKQIYGDDVSDKAIEDKNRINGKYLDLIFDTCETNGVFFLENTLYYIDEANQVFQKTQSGEKLTPREEQYLAERSPLNKTMTVFGAEQFFNVCVKHGVLMKQGSSMISTIYWVPFFGEKN